MNIALFSDSYLPTKSGVVTVVVQLKKILEEMGNHVVVVTVDSKNDDVYETSEDVFRIPSIASPVGDNQFIGIPLKKHVMEFLKEHNVQIIHSHTEFFVGQLAVKVGKKLKIPVVATTHTLWEDYYRHYFVTGRLVPKSVIRKIVKTLYKRYYALINVSQKAQQYFRQGFLLPWKPCAIIPNAIDAKNFVQSSCSPEEKSQLKKQLGIKESDKVVLYVGRIVEEKRLDELLVIAERMVQQRDDIKFLFVGNGARCEKLMATAKEDGLSDRIIFTGFVNWTELYKYYAIGNVFVTVSLSEMHSMTILEALNLGVPVVCRYDTSFSDTVYNGQNGFFAETDEEIDGLIYKILDDSSLADEMSRNSKELSKKFSLEAHGKRTMAFYEAVLSKYPRKIISKELKQAVEDAVE